jgi:hypothetical protein
MYSYNYGIEDVFSVFRVKTLLFYEAESLLRSEKSFSQEITGISWNQKIYCRFHNSPPLFPFLEPDESNPQLSILFLNIRFNIILPSVPKSSKWHFPFRFSDQNCYEFLIAPTRATCLSNRIFDLIALLIFGEEYRLCS